MTLDPALSDTRLAEIAAERHRARIAGGIVSTVQFSPDRVTEGQVEAIRAIQWPVKLTLPWSYLISDNRKYGVINGKLLLTAAYRMAKGLIRDKAKEALGFPPPEPAAFPLSLEARVWVPDNRIHDSANFQKVLGDSLESVVYTKDHYLHRITWERVGTCVDAPRAEVTIMPLAQ